MFLYLQCQAKYSLGGLILSLSQFLLLPQWSLKMMLIIKVVKIDSKIIISLPQSKSAKQTVHLISIAGQGLEKQKCQQLHYVLETANNNPWWQSNVLIHILSALE
jgi:hypothetical protein